MDPQLNNGMCRCCASEGTFKDVKTTYHWMGDEEVYAEMLRECFDIALSVNEGDDGGICEVCITQLRNASNFKKQVQHTEEQFKKRLQDELFKTDIVKIEVGRDDDNDSDIDNNASDDFSGPEYEIPIKKEEDVEFKPTKKRAAAKATTSRAKKTKTEDGETSTKRPQRKLSIKTPNKSIINVQQGGVHHEFDNLKKRIKRQQNETDTPAKNQIMKESNKHRNNITEVMQNSNATPFRSHTDMGYTCCFCYEVSYPNPLDLKQHTKEAHVGKKTAKPLLWIGKPSDTLKLDITSLHCTLCGDSINTIEQMIEHLVIVHERKLFTDIKNQILPFKFDTEMLRCCICKEEFHNYKPLQQHMNKHYRNYMCDICGAGYATKRMLKAHSECHKTGTFECSYCQKKYTTLITKKMHEKSVHTKTMVFKCGLCGEQFRYRKDKYTHLSEVHSIVRKEFKCLPCDKNYSNQNELMLHKRRNHLMEKTHQCGQCDSAFFSSHELKNHMIKHTGARDFTCDICLKSFCRKYTLKEHMRIHADDRRFKCEHCKQTFIQKCSWKGHMRSKHGGKV